MFSCWGKSIPSKSYANLSTHFHETWWLEYCVRHPSVGPVISDPSHNKENHSVHLFQLHFREAGVEVYLGRMDVSPKDNILPHDLHV